MKRAASLVSILLLVSSSVITIHAAQTPPTPSAASGQGHDALGGVWILNRDKSELPGGGNAPDVGGPPGGSGGGPPGGFGGGPPGGFGGRGGGKGGDPGQMRAIADFMRTTMAASDRLTIVVHESSVGITDADGGTLTFQTNNRKVNERAENGLVKLSRKSHWDRLTLVSEIEIDNGPKIQRKYELSPAGTELHVSTTISGGFGGRGGSGNRAIMQLYERPVLQQ